MDSAAEPQLEVVQNIDLADYPITSTEADNGASQDSLINIENEDTNTSEAHNDEHILEELFQMNRTEALSRSMLKQLGIQHPLTGWEINISRFLLTRKSVFQYQFNLSLLPI